MGDVDQMGGGGSGAITWSKPLVCETFTWESESDSSVIHNFFVGEGEFNCLNNCYHISRVFQNWNCQLCGPRTCVQVKMYVVSCTCVVQKRSVDKLCDALTL